MDIIRVSLASAIWLLAITASTRAQIAPDTTLGAESSVITPGIELRGADADLIEGGAIRGGNLFHSFTDFNVLEGQRVYFANPVGIESILSRVTGDNASAIFGTLGVDGGADLFLINPNGVVFGINAALDVEGSLYVTTAEAVEVGGGVFSAVAPGQSQLLSVNPNTSFWNYLTENSGDVVNRGQLAIGGDLILSGSNLDLQGQVAAVGNVSLLATDTIQIRDTAEIPFVGFSGGDLLVQGNQQVDIVALSHPDSGLFSYGDMVLRSANPVGGDTHYLSGGDFRVEGLDGSGGELFSPIDPIIRATGDVVIEGYQGSSLHIFAGGSVELGTIIINALEQGLPYFEFIKETVTLSDGTVVEIDGSSQSTLDVRAGMRLEAIPLFPITSISGQNPSTDQFFNNMLRLDEPILTDSPSGADISVGDVRILAPNGLVLLTNQYEANNTLPGGSIQITGDGLRRIGIDTENLSSQGGAVFLDARNNIAVIESIISTSGSQNAGNIILLAKGTVTLDGLNNETSSGIFSIITANSQDIENNRQSLGGDIRVTAENLEVLNGAQLSVANFGNGSTGNIILEITDTARFDGINSNFTNIPSGAFAAIQSNSTGKVGDIQIAARNLEVVNGAVLNTGTSGIGDGGNIILEIIDAAYLVGTNPITRRPGGIFSTVGENGNGNGGDIRVTATNLEVVDGAVLDATTRGNGNAGDVILDIGEIAYFNGNDSVSSLPSGIFNGVLSSGNGNGGAIQVTAANLMIFDGATFSSSTNGIGDAGNVILDIIGDAYIEGRNFADGLDRGILSFVGSSGRGTGGDIQISAKNLNVLNGAILVSTSFGSGNSGNITLNIEENVRFESTNPVDGNRSFAASGSSFEGDGGDIQITSTYLSLNDGSGLFANSTGQGNAGNIILNIRDHIQAQNGTITTNAFSSTGGQIQITSNSIFLLGNSDIQTFVESGKNNGGNITITANALIALDDSDILAFSADGRGGNIDLSQTNFFGQDFRFAPPGTGPRTLDGNNRVDINASGGIAAGTISLSDVSFIENNLNELPNALVNSETLVANSCIARLNDSAGTFVLTGSDSLPQQPTDNPHSTYTLGTVQTIPDSTHETTIVEPQGVYRLADGRLVMSRECG